MEIDWHHIVRSHKIIAIACLLCAWYFTDKLYIHDFIYIFQSSELINLALFLLNIRETQSEKDYVTC